MYNDIIYSMPSIEIKDDNVYRFIIFNSSTYEPVDVAKTLTEAKSRIKIIVNTKGGTYIVKPFVRLSETLKKQDPAKYKRLLELVDEKYTIDAL